MLTLKDLERIFFSNSRIWDIAEDPLNLTFDDDESEIKKDLELARKEIAKLEQKIQLLVAIKRTK